MWKRHPLRMLLLAIAAALLVALGFLVFHTNATTAPTEFSRQALGVLQLPAPPAVIKPVESRDATPMYRAAIAAYLREPERYERFADTGTWDSFKPADFPAIASVLEAAPCATGSIFKDNPEEIVAYGRKPALDAIRTLGRLCTDRLALLALKREDYDAARRYLQGGFALGQKLATERITYDELEAGFSLLGASTQGLALLTDSTDDPSGVERLRNYNQARLTFFREQVTPTLRILRSIDPNVAGTHAGDVPVLAVDSQEPMWRTEAILSLGRMRFFVGTAHGADQRGASKLLKKLAESSDNITRTAAKAALGLTVEQYRTQS